jgi:hypothetical protein
MQDIVEKRARRVVSSRHEINGQRMKFVFEKPNKTWKERAAIMFFLLHDFWGGMIST